jgi:hypothetical protein
MLVITALLHVPYPQHPSWLAWPAPLPTLLSPPPSPTGYLQARRLDELEKLYREEVVARKRAHNALQDLKGKIRVFCRVRPMLDFEANKKQVGAVMQ